MQVASLTFARTVAVHKLCYEGLGVLVGGGMMINIQKQTPNPTFRTRPDIMTSFHSGRPHPNPISWNSSVLEALAGVGDGGQNDKRLTSRPPAQH